MNVCLFRHGPAVPSGTPGIADGDRPLTAEGRRKTLEAARGLRRLGLGLDVIVSSPLPRALQTAEILSEVLKLPRPRLDPRLLPEAEPDVLLAVAKGLRKKTPVLVGHEPSLSRALGRLVGAAAFDFKKSGMAFAELQGSRGTLLLFLAPAALRKLGRRR